MESVEKIADVVLYEGYLLFPYRRSALKNQQRWTFGGVYPRQYSEASGGDDPWLMQTQCLVVGDMDTALEVKVRFLQVVDRRVVVADSSPIVTPSPVGDASRAGWRDVEELRVGEQVYRPWEEATERTIVMGATHGDQRIRLGDLIGQRTRVAIDVPAGSATEPLADPVGTVVGVFIRAWQSLQGVVELSAEPVQHGEDGALPGRATYRLTVRIVNTMPSPASEEDATWPRAAALRQTFVSTHTIMRLHGGEFISLLEPPAGYQQAAAGCANIKTWPVLVGEPGERHTLLSSPIILYDYPRISPESPGDLFDGTEIDELLTLSIMTLTDEEKQEMRASDARGRDILERTESLSPDQLIKLHGAVRGLQPVRGEEQ